MKFSVLSSSAGIGVALALACSVKSLPSGTPPPEYEKRTFEPWPPPGADAGTDAAETDAAATPESPGDPMPSARGEGGAPMPSTSGGGAVPMPGSSGDAGTPPAK
jgi:hypothetical protein